MSEKRRPRIVVVGSINMDLVYHVARLPQPGETLTGTAFHQVHSGKGANQAVAAARMNADVSLIRAHRQRCIWHCVDCWVAG